MAESLLDRLRDLGAGIVESTEEFSAGKSRAGIAARAMLAAYLAYTGVRYMTDDFHVSLFDGITLVFHEIGHLVCMGLGHTLYILGGSAMQLAVPTFAAVYLLVRQKDWFGFAVGLAWLGFSGWNLATYIADANKERLPLASMSPGIPKHDWATLLTEWHYLNSCDAIATWVRACAFSVWTVSMALSAWLIARMIRWRMANES
jgi:hypothetical protein